jgi:hypothetical protein
MSVEIAQDEDFRCRHRTERMALALLCVDSNLHGATSRCETLIGLTHQYITLGMLGTAQRTQVRKAFP